MYHDVSLWGFSPTENDYEMLQVSSEVFSGIAKVPAFFSKWWTCPRTQKERLSNLECYTPLHSYTAYTCKISLALAAETKKRACSSRESQPRDEISRDLHRTQSVKEDAAATQFFKKGDPFGFFFGGLWVQKQQTYDGIFWNIHDGIIWSGLFAPVVPEVPIRDNARQEILVFQCYPSRLGNQNRGPLSSYSYIILYHV